jgi:two-component system, cell cycle sensor histidine kinase and response regulator CckA
VPQGPTLPYALPLLLAAALSGALAVVAWLRRPTPGATTAAVLMLALGEWCLTYLLALTAPDAFWAGFWSRARYLGISVVPVAWLVLALRYTGRQSWSSWPNLGALLVVPAVTQVLVWHPSSRLMFAGPQPTAPPPFDVVELAPGPWYWVFTGYSYLLVLVGLSLLVGWLSRCRSHYHGQVALLVVAAVVPFAGNVLVQCGVLPNAHLDITPFCFLLSALATMVAIFHCRFLSLTPVAVDAVLEGMRDAVLVLDWQDRVVDLNPAAQRLLRVRANQAVGQPVATLLEAWARVAPKLPYLPQLHEEVLLREAGEVRCFDMTVTPLDEPRTRQRGRLVVLHEITELKAAQAALQENEQRYRTLFETSTDAIFLETLEGRILDCNHSACEQYGYQREEMLALTMAGLVPPEIADLASPLGRDLAHSGQFVEALGRRKSGEVFPVEVRTRLVQVGDMPLAVAFVRDLTERRQAEQNRTWKDTLLRAMAENSPLAFYVVDDRADTILYCNRCLCELWRLEGLEERVQSAKPPPGAEVGTALLRQVADPQEFDRLWRQLRNEIPRTVLEQDLVLADGRVLRWFSAQVRDFAGHYFGRLHIFEDISDRRRAADAQRLAAMGQLAAGVAHEFNNILCSMRLRADLARFRQRREEYEELVRVVIEGSQAGGRICDDMLSFARPDEPTRQAMPIEQAVETALHLCQPQLAAAQVRVQQRYHTGGRLVDVDPGQMEQVFVNLILNACDAMAGGGTLVVATDCDPLAGGQVVVEVSDTGSGIRPEHLPHIFEPFFTTKGRLGESEVPGTGLGLAASHGLLQAHGANISVRSEWGQGTTFELRFAAHSQQVDEPAATGPASQRETSPGSPRRVLLAEDEIEVRSSMVEALEGQGYSVVTAATVSEALAALRAGSFDLVITDLLMPDGDGMEVVVAAAHLPRRPPVLVITGKASESLDHQLWAAGASRWMAKPFGLSDLLSAVAELSYQPDRSPG